LAAGLTQKVLADRARLSVRGIADLERGIRRFPYTDTIDRLADALDLSAADREALTLSGRRSTVPSSRLMPSPEGPAWPSWSTTLDALPAQATRLIGREHEVGELRRRVLLSAPRLLTLMGPGGTGKTRLALAVADGLHAEFKDGIVFVDLAPLGDSELVVPTIARALGLREGARGAILEHLKQVLAGRHILMLLDNCEHVLGAASDVARLLASCSELHILATSREPLHLDWEQSVLVLPLTLPDRAGPHTPAALASVPSIALFVERAQAVEPSFQLDDNNCTAIAQLCARVDGLPLAIELAAARINVLSVPEMTEHLTKRPDILRRVGPDRPPRHVSLQALWIGVFGFCPHRSSVCCGAWLCLLAAGPSKPLNAFATGSRLTQKTSWSCSAH
jgi:transcriptional regulator with XRE-family HTH domain